MTYPSPFDVHDEKPPHALTIEEIEFLTERFASGAARLQQAGYVNTKPYRAIFLTNAGNRLAGECKRRHETVVVFLCSLGVSEKTAELDAEGIEHHVSQETLWVFERWLKKR